MKIVIEQLESGWAGWKVTCGELYADRLTIDEALGAVASTMFQGCRSPLFLRTPLQHWMFENLTCGGSQPKQIPEHARSRMEELA